MAQSDESCDLVSRLFGSFSDASNLKEIVHCFQQLCKAADLDENEYDGFYVSMKQRLTDWRCQAVWKLLDERAALPVYKKQLVCKEMRVLVVGAGPVGLRAAIEAALLGAKVEIVEKRTSFSRNNVLHLWPFLLDDLKALCAKKFYGKFAAGSIDHISIRTLQCILLKVCLILGVKVHSPVTFESVIEPRSSSEHWKVRVSPTICPVSKYNYDAIIAADGKKYCLPGFDVEERRLKLALGITVNFVNHHTQQEVATPEISGVTSIYKPDFFKNLKQNLGIELENIVYYKDDTHYFVMTAKKPSLLAKGVIKKDCKEARDLLSRSNINKTALEQYAREAATFATDGKLGKLEFALKDGKENDVAIFDFTSFFAAKHAARIVERKGKKILLAMAGDSLIEPFWPTGSGLARGFLGLFDNIWMLKQYAEGVSPLELLEEREALLNLLPSTSPERLAKNTTEYTIDPKTRYQNLNQMAAPNDVKSLYDSDTVLGEPAREKKTTPKPGRLPPSAHTVRSSSFVERDLQKNRRADQQLFRWQQQEKMQPLHVERLPEIEKLPPMPPLPEPDRHKHQERSFLGKLARLLFWWRSSDSEETLAKPKRVKTSHKERKPKEKSPSSKTKLQGKVVTTETEPSPAQKGGVKVHELAKKFTASSESSSSQMVAKEVSSSLQKGSVASAIQKLEQNIKEKQGIDMVDYKEINGREEQGEDNELDECDAEDKEMFDENKELKEIEEWMFIQQQKLRFRDDSVIQLHSGCADDLQDSSSGRLWVTKFQAVLNQALNELRHCYCVQEVKGTLETLNFLYRNIMEDPSEDTYRRILLNSDRFRKHICNYPEALQFMWSCGWMEVDRYLVLPVERSLAIAMPVLDHQIQLTELVLQSHHLNQWLGPKSELSAGRLSVDSVKQGSSISSATTSKVPEEAGRNSTFPSAVGEPGENTVAQEGTDSPQLKRMEEATTATAAFGQQSEREGRLRQRTSTYALYLNNEELEELENIVSIREHRSRGIQEGNLHPMEFDLDVCDTTLAEWSIP